MNLDGREHILTAIFTALLLVMSGCATAPTTMDEKGSEVPSPSRPDRLKKPPSRKTDRGSDPTTSSRTYQLMSALKRNLEAGKKVDIKQAERLIRTAPDSSYGRFLAGSIYLDNGDIENAREQFIRSSELDPANASALSELGDMSLDAGDLTAADQYYLKAHEAASTPATANRLALLRIGGGYLESAEEILTQAMSEYPDDIMTRNNLAIAMDMMGKTSEGINILTGDEITDPQLLRTRALLQLKEGHPDRATLDMETVFETGSSNGDWLLLGTADLQQGNLTQAEDKFRSAVVAQPSSYEGYLNLGLALRRQGKFTEAEKVYLEGLAMASHPDLHLNLGVLYELYRGEPAQALDQYRKYVQLEGPASDRVRGWVEYLEGVVENQ